MRETQCERERERQSERERERVCVRETERERRTEREVEGLRVSLTAESEDSGKRQSKREQTSKKQRERR